MKDKPRIQNQFALALTALAFGASASLGLAAAPMVLNTFDTSDLANWQGNGGMIQWDGTQDAGGTSKAGAMMVWYTNSGAAGWQSGQPQRNLASQAFNTSNYWSVSFDFKLDPNSSPGADAPFGHLQVVPIDSTWTWLSGIGWTALDETYTNWHHIEIGFQPPYTGLNALVFQVGDSGFSGDVIFYLDNITINPVPYTLYVNRFTNSSEADGWVWQNWSKPGTSAWTASPDAGGSTPAGSLQLDCNFENPVDPVYQQVVFQKNLDGDPNRFTYLDLDVRMDPSSYPMGNGSYPTFETILNVNGNWEWASLGTLDLTTANTNWTHLSFPLAGVLSTHAATNMHAVTLKLGGGWDGHWGPTNSAKLFVDNLKFWTPQVAPTLSLLQRSGPAGLQIACTAPTDDWQRQNIVTPSWTRNYSWVNAGQPVTYSFTITNFPDPAVHPGFEAHMYLVNYDTLPGPGFDETYSAVDWNAKDLVNVKFQNSASGGVDFSFNFKTNNPGANVDQTVATIHDDSALGAWAVTFADNTSVALTTPSGAQTSFVLPQEVANAFNGAMTLHFGTFKNRVTNNAVSATFSRIQVTGVPNPIDETFPGPGLNPDAANPFWRLAADPAGLLWVPTGTAWWLTWSLPDTGFGLQTTSNLSGTWTELIPPYIAQGSTSKSAAIPVAGLSANAGFFRLAKPNQ